MNPAVGYMLIFYDHPLTCKRQQCYGTHVFQPKINGLRLEVAYKAPDSLSLGTPIPRDPFLHEHPYIVSMAKLHEE